MVDPNIIIAIEEVSEAIRHANLCQSIQLLAIVLVLSGIMFFRK